MATLRVESVKLTEDYAASLAAIGFPAPWELDDEEPGNIHAASGAYICTVDTSRNLEDHQVIEAATAIIIAVNTCAGFRAVREPADGQSAA